MPDGKRKAAKAKLGDSLLDVVLENNLDIDGYGKLFSVVVHTVKTCPFMLKSTLCTVNQLVSLINMRYRNLLCSISCARLLAYGVGNCC